MEQYALLRQKARQGEQENAAVLASIGSAFTNPDNLSPRSEWDCTVEEAQNQIQSAGDSQLEFSDEEKAYYKAVGGNKRGDSVLTDHLNRKAAKAMKRARVSEDQQHEMGGVPINSQNARFNNR